ncbi:MAG TPA: MerR family transcriptional regulator [Telluria sp.]
MKSTSMEKISPQQSDESAPSYRSGVAARLAGLPVETLRVWERRYGLSETQRSDRGQRLYSARQVRYLGLLKQLVDQGHPIGSLANLPVEQLEALVAGRADERAAPAGPVRVAVVGENLRRRIGADSREGGGLDVRRSCDRLEDAAVLLAKVQADVLLVEVSELDQTAVPHIVAARDGAGVAAVVVLYRFCASATIRALREQGCLVARVPSEMGELVLLCRSALTGKQVLATPPGPAREVVAARRYDEQMLARIAAAGAAIQCECPRHLSDILLMIGSFERYSAQCANRNEADAQLHLDLEHASGLARTILEAAMDRLARAEGLDLPAAR